LQTINDNKKDEKDILSFIYYDKFNKILLSGGTSLQTWNVFNFFLKLIFLKF
jgi:hypothetical protein